MRLSTESWSLEHDMVVRTHGAGPELVWIHGLGEQSASFDAITRHRALAGFTHVLVDLPGYGRAPWPDALADGDSLVHAADHLVRWLGGMSPILVGHSQGGVIATLVAERTAVRGVINIDGNLTLGDCTFSMQAKHYTPDEFAARGFAAMRDEVYRNGVGDLSLRGYHAAMCMASPYVFHRNALDLVAASERGDLAARLVALRAPSLFVVGAPGGICEVSRQLLRDVRACSIDISPSGHWPFIDQQDAFASAVADFLSKLA